MAYTLQLADIKESTIKNIAGVCSTGQAFIDFINKAQRQLLKRGNFLDTEQWIQICIQGCVVTWPRYVSTVLALRFCESAPAHLANQWYAFIGGQAHRRGSGYHGGDGGHGLHSDISISDFGTAPMYGDVSGSTGKLIRYHVVKQEDYGKKITLYGRAYGGQPLQEKVNGVWQLGLTLTAAPPFASTSIMVTKIDSIVRDPTQGMTYLYEYDPVTQVLRNLASYEPNETNPRYRRSLLSRNPCHGKSCANDPYGLHYHRLEALVKLEFVPLVNDRDFLVLDDPDALEYAVEAIKCDQANDDQTAEVKWTKAIRELNFADRNKFPDEQTPVRVSVVDGGAIRNPT